MLLTILLFPIAMSIFHFLFQRNLLKCKVFCYAEFVLLCLEFLRLIFASIGQIIWTLIVIGLRGYGIWIIGGLVRSMQSDLGESATFPWNHFPEPVHTQDKSNVSPGHQIPPV